ncbi:MAG: methylmalonyl-CoA mutase family protein [Thermodesulfobacteriota bacterium]|nr:methylmalonyl-CoA mutase family protein [Thermodesulfobacteriota bacterium]
MEKDLKKDINSMYREKVTDFKSGSGIELKYVYTPEDVKHIDFKEEIGLPGEYPFTRGHHPLMYRGKLWNMREISGLSTAKPFNERLKFLIEEGQGAIDWEVDGPTSYMIEPDQPVAIGQLGVCGVALHRLRDVEELCKGLPLGELSISIAQPLPAVAQSLILVAKKRGVDTRNLRGVGGAIFPYTPPILPSYKEVLCINGGLSTLGRWGFDFYEYVLRNHPKWNIWYTSSYDFREAGGNAIHEIAYTIAVRDEVLRQLKERGIDPSIAAAALSPVLAVDRDFFEEIAKMRAARRLWARSMKERWGCTDPKALTMRFHVDISGYNYTRRQPLTNIARGTLGTLAAVIGGAMGIQNPSFDEAWCLPTEEAVRVAVRSQQVVRYESGAPCVADPLGGSYFIESLTSRLEEEAMEMVNHIEDMGGWIEVVESGWARTELEKGLLEMQGDIESGERVVVGANAFRIPEDEDFKPRIYSPDHTNEIEPYLKEYKEWKEKRDNRGVKEALEELRRKADKKGESLVPPVFAALEAEASFAEIAGVLRMADGLSYDWAGELEYPF